MDALPTVLQKLVLSKLEDPYDLGRCRRVCRCWHSLVMQQMENVWERHVKRHIPSSVQLQDSWWLTWIVNANLRIGHFWCLSKLNLGPATALGCGTCVFGLERSQLTIRSLDKGGSTFYAYDLSSLCQTANRSPDLYLLSVMRRGKQFFLAVGHAVTSHGRQMFEKVIVIDPLARQRKLVVRPSENDRWTRQTQVRFGTVDSTFTLACYASDRINLYDLEKRTNQPKVLQLSPFDRGKLISVDGILRWLVAGCRQYELPSLRPAECPSSAVGGATEFLDAVAYEPPRSIATLASSIRITPYGLTLRLNPSEQGFKWKLFGDLQAIWFDPKKWGWCYLIKRHGENRFSLLTSRPCQRQAKNEPPSKANECTLL